MGSYELRNILIIKSIKSPFFWICCLYVLTAKGHLEIIDTEYSLRTAKAILENATMLIEPVCDETRKISPIIDGTNKIYSQYGIGLVAIFLPIVCVGKLISFGVGLDQKVLIDFLISFYNIPFALLGLYFFRSILLQLGNTKPTSNFCMVLLFLCTGFWKYSVTDFSEITQATFLLGAINSLLLEKNSKLKYTSFWLAILVAIKLAYVILLPIFFIYVVCINFEKTDFKELWIRVSHFCSFLFPMALLLASINYYRFGSIFETGYSSEAESFSFSLYNFKRDWFDYIFSTLAWNHPLQSYLNRCFFSCFFIPKHKKSIFHFCCFSNCNLVYFYVLLD